MSMIQRKYDDMEASSVSTRQSRLMQTYDCHRPAVASLWHVGQSFTYRWRVVGHNWVPAGYKVITLPGCRSGEQ